MGKLNLLHHKSWHVYSKDNMEKVEKDKQKAAKMAQHEEERVAKAEQEARIERMRLRVSTDNNRELRVSTDNNREPQQQQESTQTHVNLFKEEERQQTKATIVNQKAIEQKAWEDKHTMFLGETKDGQKEKPWYGTSDYGARDRELSLDPTKRKKREKSEEKRKKKEDPIELMRTYLEGRAKEPSSSSSSSISKVTKKTGQSKTVEQLRKERIERELQERNRTAALMNPQQNAHVSDRRYYHSQFNRNV